MISLPFTVKRWRRLALGSRRGRLVRVRVRTTSTITTRVVVILVLMTTILTMGCLQLLSFVLFRVVILTRRRRGIGMIHFLWVLVMTTRVVIHMFTMRSAVIMVLMTWAIVWERGRGRRGGKGVFDGNCTGRHLYIEKKICIIVRFFWFFFFGFFFMKYSKMKRVE
jgi:hypothetical protein